MSLCEGCERFREQLFPPDGHGEPYQLEADIKIHDNYAELSACADSVCELCMFVRRECWYDQMLYVEENFSKFSEDAIHLAYMFDSDWAPLRIILEGTQIGIDTHETSIPYGVPSKILEFDEIREANPSLQNSVDLCNKWLSVCRDRHKQCWSCSSTGIDKFLPTRLLDVSVPGQQSIRLVLSDEIPDRAEASYVTLSYCWGTTNSTACTTSENLSHRLEGIIVDSLPQTVQDAILVTRKLKIKYLWIDALCIIQGDSSENSADWTKELPRMGKIYRQSALTIAASSGSSSDAGFAHRKNAASWPVRDCYLYGKWSDGNTQNVLRLKPHIPRWSWIDEYSPLSSRGWVLQERMLASRTLYWTDDGIFWQCDELNASEYAITSVTQNRYDKFPIRIPEIVEQVERYQTMEQLSAQTNSCLQGLPQWDLLSAWYITIEELSKRSFSVESDRIPAITGLGNEIAQACGVDFECGTFKPVPPQTLAWRSDRNRDSGPCVPRRIPGAPSWSWGSTNGRVFFPARYYWYDCVNLARVISLIGPELKISCRLGREIIIRNRDAVRHWNIREGSRFDWSVDFDTTDDEPTEQEKTVKCFILMEIPMDRCIGNTSIGAIFLSAVDEERHVYRRIGWANIPDQDHFDKEYTEITII